MKLHRFQRGLLIVAERGHPFFISAFYDEKELKRSREWRDTARGIPGVKGVIYSSYADNWSMLKPFAELMNYVRRHY